MGIKDLGSIGVGRTEAETLTLRGYLADWQGGASGGRAIRTGWEWGSGGEAEGGFTGAAGSYQLRVGSFNEGGGAATWRLKVNGATVGSWTGEGGSGALETRSFGVSLRTGDRISIEGVGNREERAKVDWLEVVAGGAAPPPPSGGETVRILPLGDSNTWGYRASLSEWTVVGYRKKLYDLLSGAGRNFDFVGSQSNGDASLPDRNHEGTPGRLAADLQWLVQGYMRAENPDVVLLMIGTNDVLRRSDGHVTAPRDIAAITRKIHEVDPDTIVFVATLPPITTDPSATWRQQAANAALPSAVDFSDPRLRQVDMAGLQMRDGVHPTDAGYDAMGLRWFQALQANADSVFG